MAPKTPTGRQCKGDDPGPSIGDVPAAHASGPAESGLSLDEQMAWGYFLKAYKVVVEAVDTAVRAGSDLSLPEYEVLFTVALAGGRLRFIDLARHTLLSQSRISRQIDALQKKGLLRREITAADRRATFAVMTPKGRRAWTRARVSFRAAMRKHFVDRIPSAELSAFTEVLENLLGEPSFRELVFELARQSRNINRH